MQCVANGATAKADEAMFLSPMAERLLAVLRQRPYTTWLQVRQLEGAKGCNRFCWAPNEVIWEGISAGLYQAYQDLDRAGLVELIVCDARLYLDSGVTWTIPIAAKPSQFGYADPHWLPTVLAIPGSVA